MNGVILVNTLSKMRIETESSTVKIFYRKGYFNAPAFVIPDYNNKQTRESPYPEIP